MNQNIIQINETTWRIEDGGVRFFVLAGEDSAAVIDTGMQCPEAKQIAESLTDRTLILLNTHTDRDHTSGNSAFDTVYLGAGECSHYMSQTHAEQNLVALFEGDVIDLGGRTLTVVDLAGHTPGSIGFIDSLTEAFISGDSIQKGGNIFMFGDHRSFPAYIGSLKHLQKSSFSYKEIWPSHSEIPVDPSIIPGLIQDAEKIVKGDYTGREIEMHGRPALAVQGTDNIFLCPAKK